MKTFICLFVCLSLGFTTTHAQGSKLTATYSKGVITLSDGRKLTVKKSNVKGFGGGWYATYVNMNAPTGAKVTITYDNNAETFKGEVPFSYKVNDSDNKDAFFKLTVDEGGPDKTWSIKLQNEGGKQTVIQ